MTPRWRLAAAGAAFCAWLGWLAYLVATASHPIVLSRPQFLAADLVVIATLRDGGIRPASTAKVDEIVGKDAGLSGRDIEIPNLNGKNGVTGWRGPGQYILPLVRQADTYLVAPIPPSPGYDPNRDEAAHIYPRTPETERQLREIR